MALTVEQIQRRRTIDQHVAEIRCTGRERVQRRERVAQAEGAVARLADFELEPGEIERRRREMQPRDRGRDDRIAQRRLAGQNVVGRERRLRRSMPRPVEALPCGSRSMISTSSPIAASAVPRLMAVVVLPTPPF